MMDDGRCVDCFYYNPFNGVCSNGLSKFYRRFINKADVCDEFVQQMEDEDENEPEPEDT